MILVPSKMKSPYQTSKVVNIHLILLEAHAGYTAEVCKYHRPLKALSAITIFCVDEGLYLHFG